MDNLYEKEGTSDINMETICSELELVLEVKKTFYDIL